MTNSEVATESRSLQQMRVADLQSLASNLGVKGGARMRKSVLIDAITQAQASADRSLQTPKRVPEADTDSTPSAQAESFNHSKSSDAALRSEEADSGAKALTEAEIVVSDAAQQEEVNAVVSDDAQPIQTDSNESEDNSKQPRRNYDRRGRRGRRVTAQVDEASVAPEEQRAETAETNERVSDSPLTLDDIQLPPAREGDAEEEPQPEGQQRKRNRSRSRNNRQNDEQNKPQETTRQDSAKGNQPSPERKRNKRNREDADPEIAPDDILLPIAGILDVLDSYAFVRTSGYLAGNNDVYVSLGQVKKYNLRKGDAIVGAIRQPREGEYQSGRQKYNALVKIDTVNGEQPDPNRIRAEFDSLTALYPNERITLETPGGHAAQRMIDLFSPIGKGTRGLIIAPPKSGKSIMLERIAQAIATNSPDTHVMLVLVDERPEEVTRLERTVHGEVVSSTFDMPAENHTTIAELAIERAKRLVELGLDVVVLLDSVTHLCRAYNLTAPASGHIIAGGVDASALYPAKRFFGAARNVENGGSLTILATAMVETGSRTDEVILEEFAGTANMELRLSREMANRRIFPAVDIPRSSTLHEEQLLDEKELAATWSIRRAHGEDAQGSLEPVLERISQTTSNDEFLASVRRTPISSVSVR